MIEQNFSSQTLVLFSIPASPPQMIRKAWQVDTVLSVLAWQPVSLLPKIHFICSENEMKIPHICIKNGAKMLLLLSECRAGMGY